MKKTILAIAILTSLFSTVAGAATLKEFAGAYEVNTSFMNVALQGNVTIDVEGNIKFLVYSPYLYLNCVGTASMINNELVSTPACENGMAITLKINLSQISDFSKFQAPVYTTIINAEVPMDFKRL